MYILYQKENDQRNLSNCPLKGKREFSKESFTECIYYIRWKMIKEICVIQPVNNRVSGKEIKPQLR